MIDVVEVLQRLVRVPSMNPMGRDVTGPEYLEHALTDLLEEIFNEIGLAFERHTVVPGRDNILARLDGRPALEDGGKLLLLESHQDTVPVDGMTIEPFSGAIEDGRVWGRGSCDIKGGMACMITALARLRDETPDSFPTVVLACTVDEEHGFTGATSLVDLWQSGKSSLLPCAPDAAIVAEPTLANVVAAHKGVVRWKCHTRGKACHSAFPSEGENAIYKMSGVLSAFEKYAGEIVPQLGEHPLLGSPTISVGTIGGGTSVNTVADRCTIEIDRRILPSEEPDEVFQHAVQYVASQEAVCEPPEQDYPSIIAMGLSDEENADLANNLCRASKECGGPGELIGVPFGTDAPHYSRAGVPTVVFGPGSIEQAHTKDEWIAISELRLATEILFQFAQR